MADEIFLEGLRFFGRHGVMPEERARGQRFVVDLRLDVDTRLAGRTDALGDTVDYSAMYDLVRTIVEGPARDLIETVAETVAQAALDRDERILAVEVTVRKPEVGLGGAHLDAAGVRIRRSRATITAVQRRTIEKPRPLH